MQIGRAGSVYLLDRVKARFIDKLGFDKETSDYSNPKSKGYRFLALKDIELAWVGGAARYLKVRRRAETVVWDVRERRRLEPEEMERVLRENDLLDTAATTVREPADKNDAFGLCLQHAETGRVWGYLPERIRYIEPHPVLKNVWAGVFGNEVQFFTLEGEP